MRLVIDTNVLVSSLLSPDGPPGRVLALLLAGRATLCYDGRIAREYRDVLRRPRFGFDSGAVESLLDFLFDAGESVVAPPLPLNLPDPVDAIFIEAAVAADADRLVTGNTRHFPARHRHGVTVVTPARFVRDFIDSI